MRLSLVKRGLKFADSKSVTKGAKLVSMKYLGKQKYDFRKRQRQGSLSLKLLVHWRNEEHSFVS